MIGRSPFKAVFGSDPKLGVQSLNLPEYLIPTITTEEQLEQLTKQLNDQKHQDQQINQQVNSEFNEGHNQEDSHKALLNDLENKTIAEEEIMVTNLSNDNNNIQEDFEEIMVTNLPNGHNIQVDILECTSSESNSVNIICVECHELIFNIGEAIKCEICKLDLHFSCADNGEICNICNTKLIIEKQQIESFKGQKRQAEQMMAVTKKILPNLNIGDCVLINVDKVDRSPGDPPNLITVVTDIKNGVYQVGTAGGIIKSWFNRPDMKKSTSNFITMNKVNKTKFISLREVVSLESLFKGQGYVKCACQPSKTQWKTNRCQCFKAKLQCNSRCHKSGPCINK